VWEWFLRHKSGKKKGEGRELGRTGKRNRRRRNRESRDGISPSPEIGIRWS
jgi:hypothetical protein